MKLNFRLFGALLVLSLAVFYCQAQSAPDPDSVQGLLPYNSYSGGNIDSVSMSDGNLIVHIPLISYPQRGKVTLSYSISYNNKNYTPNTMCTPLGDCTLYYWIKPPQNPGVGVVQDNVPSVRLNKISLSRQVSEDGTMVTEKESYTTTSVVDSSGASHPMAPLTKADATMESVDATGIMYVPSPGYIYDQNGTRWYSGCQLDIDGNQLCTDSSGNWLDTLGRSIPRLSGIPASGTGDTSQCVGPLPSTSALTESFPSPNGSTAPFTFCYATFSINEEYNVTEGYWQIIENVQMLQSVILPDGKAWIFSYSNDGYGNLTQITLPTGGTISYQWTNFLSTCGSSPVGTPWVASRIVNANDGSGPHTWNYTWSASEYKVTDPDGNDTTYVDGGAGPCASVPEIVKYYQGSESSGKLLKTVTTAYSYYVPGSTSAYGDTLQFLSRSMNIVPTEIDTTLANGLTTKKTFTYDSGFTFVNPDPGDANSTFPGVYGKIITESDFDYGSGQAGPMLRKTANSYSWQSDARYVAANLLDLKKSATTMDGNGNQVDQTLYSYDESGYLQPSGVTTQHTSSPAPVQGHLTTVTSWLNTGSAPTSHISYFDTGNVYQKTDPLGHATTYAYSNDYAGAYPTQVTNALGQSSSFTYDFNTGLPTGTTDSNRQTTSYTYDAMRRLIALGYPDGGQTTYTYYPSGYPTNSILAQRLMCNGSSNCYPEESNGQTETTLHLYDGFGRAIETELLSDPEGADLTLTGYDVLGRVASVTNPYRSTSDPTYGITTYTYDMLGRKTIQVQPDGSKIQWCYEGMATTGQTNCTSNRSVRTSDTWVDYSDEAGHHWQQVSDGLGRLVVVMEPDSGNNPTVETDYQYDALNNLTRVDQWGGSSGSSGDRARTFVYDSLSRLTNVCNPESIPSGSCSASGPWSDIYTYDADGNVLTKIASLPNQSGSSTETTTRTYDALNRVTSVAYSDGVTPSLHYWYDVPPSWMSGLKNVVGRLANSSNGYGGGTSGKGTATAYSYDSMGRVIFDWEQTPSASPGGYPLYSTFDLLGNLTSTRTAAGTLITYGYDSADRLARATSSLNDAQHPQTLYTVDQSVGYYPNGAVRKAVYGNGLTETFALNNRLQPCRMNLNSSGSYYSNCTSATPTGSVVDYTLSYNAGVGDNGNIANWTASGQQAFMRSYTYDDMNRLHTMTDSASGQACKGLSWTVDAWGNLTAQTPTGGTCFTFSSGANTNNRLSSYQYDAAGNVLYDGSHHYTYSAEGQILTVDGVTYVYNENGQRVRKNTASGWVEYYYGLNGSVQSEYNGGWPTQYVYTGSRLLAIYQNGTTDFVHSDHLGSTRLLTSVTQGIVDNMDYEPFGQQTSGSSATTHKFTGKERDSESGNDYFGARYYASSTGRWMSPDPSNLGVDFFLPQTWNRYGYALNNPLTMLDRNGFWPTWVHNDIIDKSFPTLSSGQRDILKQQSAAVDEDQSVAGSYKHGMVGEYCDGCFDAQGDAQKTADWISQNEHDAQELQKQWIDSGHTGLCPAALQAFGNALHTITDMTSPSHEGGQHWRDNYGDLRTYWHVLREIVPTDSNKRRQQTAIQNAQRAFWQVFGSGCHTEQTMTTIYDSNGNSIGGSVSTHLVCSN